VIESYNRHADAWCELRSQSLFERAWLDRFLDVLPPDPHILDLGCGAGQPIAQYLLQQGATITGVDGAANLIDKARAKMPQAKWITGDIRGLALGQRFDGILGWNSTFHLAPVAQREMFTVFQDHAKAGAALMFTSGPEFGEITGEFAGNSMYYASLDSAEYRALLTKHGFDLSAHVREDPSCGAHTIWLARHSV